MNRISSVIRQFFTFLNNPKDLDLSYMFREGKIGFIDKFKRSDLVIRSHSRGTNTLSYSRINTVFKTKKKKK